MTWRVRCANFRHRHSFSMHLFEPCGSVAARRIPADCRAKLSVSNPSHSQKEGSGAPKFAGAERRTRWPALRHGLSRQRTGLPAHNADRRASRRSTAAFSLDLGTAFWKRTGAPIRTPLIPRAFTRFHPLHQPVAGRTHVVGPGGVSRGPRRPGWLGRTLRRRPRSANKRHRLTPSVEQGWMEYRRDGRRKSSGVWIICESSKSDEAWIICE